MSFHITNMLGQSLTNAVIKSVIVCIPVVTIWCIRIETIDIEEKNGWGENSGLRNTRVYWVLTGMVAAYRPHRNFSINEEAFNPSTPFGRVFVREKFFQESCVSDLVEEFRYSKAYVVEFTMKFDESIREVRTAVEPLLRTMYCLSWMGLCFCRYFTSLKFMILSSMT